MRRARLVGALVTSIVSLTVTTLGQGVVSPAAATGRPEHDLVAKGYEKGATDKFFVEGSVPTYPRGRIKVLRNVNGGTFTVYKRVETRRSGRFVTRIYEAGRKKTCFKVQVPATSTHRRTTSENLGCITVD